MSTTSPQPASVLNILARAADDHPDLIAAEDGPRSLTYRELVDEAEHFAAALVQEGVRTGDRVVVRMSHSVDLLVAILGVLLAGAAYVPVDTGYPAKRRQLIIEDSGARVMVVDRDTMQTGADGGPAVLSLDGARSRPRGRLPAPGGDHLACVIYTSGSTGEPKGVMITHKGLANLAHAASGEFAMNSADRYLMLASAAFSASLEELFPPLVQAATVVFPPDRAALSSVEDLLGFAGEQRITLLELQTAHWHVVVQYLKDTGSSVPASLRLLVVGGERALPDLVRRWNAVSLPFVHVYGPTETTATATYHTFPAGGLPDAGQLPIGSAIPNTHLHVVDDELRPVPSGTPGELVIGGASLAWGYLGKPVATASRFVPDGLSGTEGGLLYRTGDLVRDVPGAGLVFVDRVDRQVKVRGYRIEPAEVEAALQEHPDVAESAVVVREDSPGQRRLVAYVTGVGSATDRGALREFLSARLPAYTVPSAFMHLDRLPLTVHRKVDQAALPAPRPQRPPLSTDFVSPEGEVERELVHSSAALLGIDEIGVTDDFLELGGDSLFVLRLITQIKTQFAVGISVAEAFSHPTVRSLAGEVARQLGDTVERTGV